MIPVYGDQEPERQSHSQLPPHTLISEEPDRHPRRPWFKRPNISWILCMKMLTALSYGMGSGPRIEIFTEIICRGYYHERLEGNFLISPSGGAPTSDVLHNSPLSLAQATGYSSSSFGRCTGDPQVQAQVAKVTAMFAIIGGVLSFFTAGWWGGFMDRHGRTRIMGIVIFSSLLNDFLTLMVFFFPNEIPGGYWILIITPFVEGFLGTPSTPAAAETTYMRDVSEPHDLSRNFAVLVGMFHIGGTIGPIISGFLSERTGNVITVLFATTILHVIYASIAWFALPESVSEASMIHARHQYANELASAADADAGPFRRRFMVFTKAFWHSFPLHVLTPKRLPNSRWKRDYNLTLLALSAGLINVIMASVGEVFQYGLYTFKWSSLQLGYFISASGFSAAVFLTAILPVVVSALKRAPARLRHTENARRDTVFDLQLLRVSSLIIAAGYALMALAPTGLIFTLCYMITTFGQGFIPAVQSVAIMLYASASGQDDAGRLLTALGVTYGLGGRLFGPFIFGAVFANTVSFFPTAIFWTAVGCALAIFFVLAFIRLPISRSVQDAEQRDSFVLRGDGDDTNPEREPLLEHE